MLLDRLWDATAVGHRLHLPDERSAADRRPIPLGPLLDEASERATHLARRGDGPVGIVLVNTLEAIRTALAIWLAGRPLVSLPIPARGASLASYLEEVRQLADATATRVVFVDDGFVAATEGAVAGIEVAAFSSLAAPPAHGVEPVRAPVELVQHSSGSTGRPTPVALGDAALLANVEATLDRLAVGPGATSCSWLPLSHDMGFIGMFLASLCGGVRAPGGTTVIGEPTRFVARPDGWLQRCADTGATITAAPSFALDLAGAALARRRITPDLSALQACIIGADHIDPHALDRFGALLVASGATAAAACPAYGMAEAGLAVTLSAPGEAWRTTPAPTPDGSPVVCCGAPLDGYAARIGPDDRISVAGPSIEGWLRTPDLGIEAGGELAVLGRADDVIVVRGRKVAAHDLESVAATVSGVRPGCVVATMVDGLGLTVLVELARPPDVPPPELVADAIRRRIGGQVGIWPERVVVVERGTVPKTPSGKLRRSLAAQQVGAGDLAVVVSLDRPSTTPSERP